MSTPKPTRKKSRLIRQSPAKTQAELDKLARLAALEARQAELEKRIGELERDAARQTPQPWTAPTDRIYPVIPTTPVPAMPSPFDEDGRCHVCNNRWKDMTHYVCNNNRCPSRVWCGDPALPVFTCGGDSSSTTVGSLTVPKPGAGPYGAPGTIMLVGHNISG